MADTQSIRDIPVTPSVQQMVNLRPPFTVPGQNWMVKALHGNKQAKSMVGPVVQDLGAFDTEADADKHIANLEAAGYTQWNLFKTRMNVWGPMMPPRDIVTEKYFSPFLNKLMTKEHEIRNAQTDAFIRRMDEKFTPTKEAVAMDEDIRESSSAQAKRPKPTQGYTIGKPQTTRPTDGQIIGDVTMGK
jgi:hypothetical protein